MGRKRKELPLLRSVHITGVAAEGKALAKLALNPEKPDEKLVLFVPYAAPGDVADIKVDRKKHSFAEGHIETMIVPSPLRVKPRCRYFGICGGCKWQHMPYAEQLKFKQQQVLDALTRIGHLTLPDLNPILGCADPWHYRNKMEYTFSNKKWRTWEEVKSGREFADGSDALGFHIPGQFDKVLHLEECHLQDPLGDRIRNFIYDYGVEHGYSFYDLRANQGLLRTLMLRILSTGQVMACLSFGEDDPERIEALMSAVAARFPEITSLLYVVNTKGNDTIFDLPVHSYRGPEYVEERMEGLTFRISPKSFYQTNSPQAYRLYSAVRRMAGLEGGGEGEKPLVYDLYTGTGTIAQFVARSARKVIGIEYVPEAIEDAKINAAANGIENAEFLAGDMKDILTDEFIAAKGRPDIMLIDPPRAGMHPDVVAVILRALPRRIVYVSCNPATQARDLALLAPSYRITEVQPVDMFPHTHHVENVVALERID